MQGGRSEIALRLPDLAQDGSLGGSSRTTGGNITLHGDVSGSVSGFGAGIENYPDDKYSPSALLLGFTVAGRPLHFQVAFDDSQLSKIITIYQPDPNEWIEFRKRGGHV